jgi:hypothetical protein
MAGGDLLAYAGDGSGVNMACTVRGAACDAPGAFLLSTHSSSDGSLSGCKGWSCRRPRQGRAAAASARGNSSDLTRMDGGGPGSSRSASSDATSELEASLGLGDSTGSGAGGAADGECILALDAKSPYVCVAGLPGSSEALMQSSEVLKFQLPASFYVYVSVLGGAASVGLH